MNYPLLKRTLDLQVAVNWLVEDAKDDFFPDPLGFKEISTLSEEYLVQREHRFLQVDAVTTRMEYVPKANGMLREAIWLHPNHRLLYLAALHQLLPKIDNQVLGCVYSYRRDAESRTPDIGELKMSAFSSERLADGVAHSHSRSWEKGWGRVQFLAEFGDHSRAMNRALCGQRDAQFLMGHLDVCPAG